MRVRSVVINNFDHSIINYKTDNNYKKYIKLSKIIERIDNKISTIKCFKNWKKAIRMDYIKYFWKSSMPKI